jgi:hypothetical protein
VHFTGTVRLPFKEKIICLQKSFIQLRKKYSVFVFLPMKTEIHALSMAKILIDWVER